MVGTHAACTHAAERKVRIGNMHDRIVHASSSEAYMFRKAFCGLFIIRKNIQSERFFTFFYKTLRFLHAVNRYNRKHRSEDFLLHYGICARDSIHHRWLNLKPLCIRMSAENNLLRIYKPQDSVKMFLIYDFTVIAG